MLTEDAPLELDVVFPLDDIQEFRTNDSGGVMDDEPHTF
ncbi:hypothetical protein BKA25_000457 [Actinoalloteichus hymeniacidonis]|nr:hypothetical protein [Actinoalloteichus hymeniacidonis]